MSTVEVAMERLAELRIEGLGAGDVTLVDSGGPGVRGQIEASDAEWLQQVRVRPDDTRASLLIEFPRDWLGRSRRVKVELAVPAGVHTQIESGSGDIVAQVATGRTRVVSGSGDVVLQAVEEVECRTGSGDIRVHSITGPHAQLRSGSGDIRVGQCHAAVQAKAGSGDIVLDTLHAELAASSGSGDITVPATTGSVSLKSASGSLRIGVADGLPAWLDLTSISGTVDVSLPPSQQPERGEPYVTISGRTASGDITVHAA